MNGAGLGKIIGAGMVQYIRQPPPVSCMLRDGGNMTCQPIAAPPVHNLSTSIHDAYPDYATTS